MISSDHARSEAVTFPAARFAPVLLILILLAYLGTQGALPLLGRDEPRYVQIGREMWERRDLVTPMLGGHTWFEKPALLYWMIFASFGAFGVSEWSARLGPALCGLAIIGMAYLMGRRVERLESGHANLALCCAAVSASSLGLIAFSHGATFDIVLTATIALSLGCFFLSELEEGAKARRLWLLGFWAGVGLSLMAKGLVGMVLPALVILLYALLRRDARALLRTQLWWGVPVALLVAALWYGPVIARHGMVFVDEFFVQHHFARYLSDKYQHREPFYFFVPVLAVFGLPWTLFALASLRENRLRGNDASTRLGAFALAWLLAPLAFFSLSGSKLPGYIMPALPGLALLAALGAARYLNGSSGVNRARITGGALIVAAIAGIVYAARKEIAALEALLVMLPLLLAGAFALLLPQRRALCVASIAGAVLLSTILVSQSGVTQLAERRSARSLLRLADARGDGNLPILMLHEVQRSAEFYAAGRVVYDERGEPVVLRDDKQVAQALSDGRAALLLVPTPLQNTLLASSLLQSEKIGDNGSVALFRVRRKTVASTR